MTFQTEHKIDVLDHGFVRLVSYMQSVHRCVDDGWSGDLEVVRNARVSYDADARTGDDEGSDNRLIRSMMDRGHTSPFEAMVFTFEVKCPLFVARQWQRHRTWSYNELSARYAPVQEDFYIPAADQVCGQHETDKQMRSSTTIQHVEAARDLMQRSNEFAFAQYKYLLTLGVARELARSVLPVAMYTRMFATVDLHNLMHFLRLRLDEHAQYEIRVYAQALIDLVAPICPTAVEKFYSQLNAAADAKGT